MQIFDAASLRPTKLAVIGTGYVGIASTIGFAEIGNTVVGYDILADRIRDLKRGRTPYHEAGLSEALARHVQTGAVSFTDDLRVAVDGAEFIIVAVGTPTTAGGSADLSAVEAVFSSLAAFDLSGARVVLRSTVPPGTCDRFAEQLRGNAEIGYSPEFLREGSAVADFLNPDRIVIGGRSESAMMRYADLLSPLGRQTLVMSPPNAELAKGMSNAFLAMKISFANQVANLCDKLDADALEVLDAVGSDRRIGRQFLHPGIGFGGPCFEKDLKSLIHLSKRLDVECDLLSATLAVNDRQPTRIASILQAELGRPVRGMRLGAWGLTFKGGTDDVRDSLAVRVVEDLASKGAEIVAYDPAFRDANHTLPCRLAMSALDAADAETLLILTDWPQFRAIDMRSVAQKIRTGLVVDGRNMLDGDSVAAAGLRYRGIGRRRESEASVLAAAG
jgi:UDPglucose 6-dehydrogenase